MVDWIFSLVSIPHNGKMWLSFINVRLSSLLSSCSSSGVRISFRRCADLTKTDATWWNSDTLTLDDCRAVIAVSIIHMKRWVPRKSLDSVTCSGVFVGWTFLEAVSTNCTVPDPLSLSGVWDDDTANKLLIFCPLCDEHEEGVSVRWSFDVIWVDYVVRNRIGDVADHMEKISIPLGSYFVSHVFCSLLIIVPIKWHSWWVFRLNRMEEWQGMLT